MTGNLQIKNDTYYAVLNLKEGGKYKQKWISTKLKVKGNKRKATEMLNDFIEEYSKKGILNTPDTKFIDYAKKWLERKTGKVEQSTWDSYYNSVIKHIAPYFKPLNLNIADLKTTHVRDYYDYELAHGRKDGKGGLSKNSMKELAMVFKSILNDAVYIDEIIEKSPALKIPIPECRGNNSAKVKPVFLNIQQANEMLQLFNGHRLQPLIYITLYYGLRKSEVVGLKWDAIDFENKKLTIKHTVVRSLKLVEKDRTKSKTSYRSFKICPKMENIFKQLYDKHIENKKLFGDKYINSGYVFAWENGKRYSTDGILSPFQKVLKDNNFPHMRLHDLRHSCASILYDMGWGLKDIQRWMGHSHIETTGDIYTHISNSREALVAEQMENSLVLNF